MEENVGAYFFYKKNHGGQVLTKQSMKGPKDEVPLSRRECFGL